MKTFLFLLFLLYSLQTSAENINLTIEPDNNGYILNATISYGFRTCYSEVHAGFGFDFSTSSYRYNGQTISLSEIDESGFHPNTEHKTIIADVFKDSYKLGRIVEDGITQNLSGCFGDTVNLTKKVGVNAKEYADSFQSLSFKNLKLKMNTESSRVNNKITDKINSVRKEALRNLGKNPTLSKQYFNQVLKYRPNDPVSLSMLRSLNAGKVKKVKNATNKEKNINLDKSSLSSNEKASLAKKNAFEKAKKERLRKIYENNKRVYERQEVANQEFLGTMSNDSYTNYYNSLSPEEQEMAKMMGQMSQSDQNFADDGDMGILIVVGSIVATAYIISNPVDPMLMGAAGFALPFISDNENDSNEDKFLGGLLLGGLFAMVTTLLTGA